MTKPNIPNFNKSASPQIVAVDSGGTLTRVALGAEVIASKRIVRFKTPTSLDEHSDKLAHAIATVTGGHLPDMVGYGVAGETSADGLTIVKGGAFSTRGWLHKPITEMAAESVGITVDKVLLLNDLVTAGLAQRAADRRQRNGDSAQALPDSYAGLVTAISTGTNTALYSEQGAFNLESGHWLVARAAEHACGCGQNNDAEAWLGGGAIQQRFGVSGKDIPAEDPRWEQYRQTLGEVMDEQLADFKTLATERGLSLEKLSLFGSVAMGNSGAVDFLQNRFTIAVAPATYGEDGGLYGAYFGARDHLAAAL